MTIEFKPNIQKILEQCGWNSNRRISIVEWEDALKIEGFSIFPLAKDFLTRLGKLTICPLTGKGCAFLSDPITIDPLLEKSATLEDIKSWGDELSLELCPIGLTSDGIKILFSKDGGIYGATSDMFFQYGDTVEEGLDCLILAKKAPETLV